MRAPPDEFDLEAARRMFWEFHWGLPSGRELELLGPRGVPAVTAQLGTLVAVETVGGMVWPKSGRIHLATDRHGKRLFLLSRDGIAVDRHTPAGRVVAIRYRTNKGDGSAVWRHEFEGTRPVFGPDRDGWPVIRRAGSGFRVTWRGIVG